MARYSNGDKVAYKPVGGTPQITLSSVAPLEILIEQSFIGPDSNTPESTGTIKSVLTEPGQQAGLNVQASSDNPRYEVRFCGCLWWRRKSLIDIKIENSNTGKTTTVFESNIMRKA